MDIGVIENLWVVVNYGEGRPDHIYKIEKESKNSIGVICSEMDVQIFEMLDNCYKRFPEIADAIKDVAKGNGHNVRDFVGEYKVLFPNEKGNLAKLLQGKFY